MNFWSQALALAEINFKYGLEFVEILFIENYQYNWADPEKKTEDKLE
jgi:hypothetical protein